MELHIDGTSHKILLAPIELQEAIEDGFVAQNAPINEIIKVAAYREVVDGRFTHLLDNGEGDHLPWTLVWNGKIIGTNIVGQRIGDPADDYGSTTSVVVEI